MPNQEPAFAGLCIKFCSNDNIANTFQSLKLKSKVIDLLDNQSLTIRTVSEVIDLKVASFLTVQCMGPFTSNTVTHGNPQVTIYSDASLTGWGGVVNSTSTGGQWSEDESKTTLITLRSWHVSSPWRHSAQMFKIVMWKLWLITQLPYHRSQLPGFNGLC